MGKKGSWFSAIRRAFTPNSSNKDKQINEIEKKQSQPKKKGRRLLKHGEFRSLIPLFREPSSIEKILEEADEEKLLFPLYAGQEKLASALPKSPRVASPSYRATSPRYSPRKSASPRVVSPRAGPVKVRSPRAASPRATSPKAASPRAISPKAGSPRVVSPRAISPKAASLRVVSPREKSPKAAPWVASPHAASPRVSLKAASVSDISPRVSFSKVNQSFNETSYTHKYEPASEVHHLSATRIQATFRGYMVRKSFKAPRGLLRLQGVVKGNNAKRQTVNAMKQMQLLVRVQNQVKSRRNQMLENEANQWQVYKNDKDGESSLSKWSKLSETGNNENWDNSRLTKDEADQRWRRKIEAIMKRERAMAYAYSHKLRKSKPKSTLSIQPNGLPWWWKWFEYKLPSANQSESEYTVSKPSPQLQNRYTYSEYASTEVDTPTSTKSALPMKSKPFHTPGRTPPYSILRKYTRSPFQFPSKDDDSLTSCPPFSVPNYMTPTASAKAKARPTMREGSLGTPSSDSRRRLTFPLTPSKWSNKDAASVGEFDRSTDRMSVGSSTVSMPAIVGRKPFNRFV